MKHVAYSILVALTLTACGKDGSDGAAGKDGTDNKLALVRVCSAILQVAEGSPASYWDEGVASYERAETVAGDITVSASVVTSDGSASGVTFFKAGSVGVHEGKITLRTTKSHSLTLSAVKDIDFLLISSGEGVVTGSPNECADI